MLGPATKNDLSPYVDVACCTWSILVSADLILERQLSVCRQMSARYVEARPFEHLWTSVASLNVTRTAIPDTCNLSYPSASAVVIHYEEVLYQVYVPLPLQNDNNRCTTASQGPVYVRCSRCKAHVCAHEHRSMFTYWNVEMFQLFVKLLYILVRVTDSSRVRVSVWICKVSINCRQVVSVDITYTVGACISSVFIVKGRCCLF